MSGAKCLRLKCERRATRQGLCHAHYERLPERGYIPAGPVRDRVELLRSRGYGLRELSEITGVSLPTLLLNYDTVQCSTAKAIMAVPVPTSMAGAGGVVSSLGTIRRIQALVAFGYSQDFIAEQLGIDGRRVSQILRQEHVLGSTAARMAVIFNRYELTPGPSKQALARGRRNGWAPPLAWDDIDNPDATPNVGVHRAVKFDERYREMRDLGLSHMEIAARLGITGESLARQMARYNIDTTGVVA